MPVNNDLIQATATLLAAKVAASPANFINDTNATADLRKLFVSVYWTLENAHEEIAAEIRRRNSPPPGHFPQAR